MSRHPAVRSVAATFLLVVACTGWWSAAPANQQTTHPLQPKALPEVIYVADFAIDTSEVKEDSGILREGGLLRGSRVQRLNPLHRQESPEETAKRLVQLLGDSLTQDLKNTGLPARRLLPGQPLPPKGWMITGEFLEVDEGNRLRRAVVGFGYGASEMQIEVNVSDMGAHSGSPFLVLGTATGSGHRPGAAVIPNPYVAAAKFVLSKNASEKDVSTAASHIASEIVQYMKAHGLLP
jgi:hypothetical protein